MTRTWRRCEGLGRDEGAVPEVEGSNIKMSPAHYPWVLDLGEATEHPESERVHTASMYRAKVKPASMEPQ